MGLQRLDENVTPGLTTGPSGAPLIPAGGAMVVDGPGAPAVGVGAIGGTTIQGQKARSPLSGRVYGVAMFPRTQHYLVSLLHFARGEQNSTLLRSCCCNAWILVLKRTRLRSHCRYCLDAGSALPRGL